MNAITIKSTDSERIVEITMTEEQWNDFGSKWFYAHQGLPLINDLLGNNLIDFEQAHKAYCYYTELCLKMVAEGVFKSKYDFRTDWVLI